MSQLMPNNAFAVGNITPSIVLYEPSFEGWLSAVFYIYANRLQDDEALQLTAQDCYVPSLIAEATSVATDEDKAERVLTKLNKLLGRSGMRNLLWGFLSEKDNIGTTLFQVVKYAIDYPSRPIMEDLGNLNVLELVQTVKSVGREKHRMEAFVRFEHTTDDIYFARVEPDFNVLPLIGEHFRQRYQDQHWAIYDLTRNYGIYYDKSQSTPKRPAALQRLLTLMMQYCVILPAFIVLMSSAIKDFGRVTLPTSISKSVKTRVCISNICRSAIGNT